MDEDSNFDISNAFNLGTYDFDSIMHYGLWAFDATGTSQTITPLGSVSQYCQIGQRNYMSEFDILHANYLIEHFSFPFFT